MIVSGTNLSMTRGDSESITVSCIDGAGDPVLFVTGDTIYFTIKSDAASTVKILQKVITEFEEDGSAIICIDHADTEECVFKKYTYDIQLTRADGTVTTIVKPATFEITKEVTHD